MKNKEYISICPTCQKNGVISPLEGEKGNDFVVCKIHGEIKVADLFSHVAPVGVDAIVMPVDTTIKIDKNIPILALYTRTKYPFSDMEIGDSFLVSSDHKSIRSVAISAGRRLNAKFTVRKVDGGLRCWRIA